MLCYDIADPKRLVKVHRMLKKTGIPVQKSVFFVQGTENDIKLFLNKLEKIINVRKDDIRAYPVLSPDKVWTTGGPLSTYPLLMPGRKVSSGQIEKKITGSSPLAGLWKHLKGMIIKK